jgi:hypothetical protein
LFFPAKKAQDERREVVPNVRLILEYYPLQASAAACFFSIFFTTHIAGCRFNSRKSAPPPAATYRLRGGEYKDPITPPCAILLRLSADTLFPAI